MARRCGLLKAAAVLLLSLPALAAQAQTYPSKPVTIIADSAPGASPDVAARIVADALGKIWGQQAVVVNHPGANGSIAARAAADAPNDGYTLFIPVSSSFLALPTVAPNLPLKLPRDFTPIGFVAAQPMFIAVAPSLGVKTLPELIALAKKKPGALSIAVTGFGRMTHLTGVLLQEKADIKLLPVPYTRGPASAIGDVASGRVSIIVEGYSGMIGSVKAGQVKLIAVASQQRLPEFPDVPTVAETIPGFSASGWLALVAPLGTPNSVITKVGVDLTKVLNEPEVRQKLATTGSYAQSMTAQQVLAFAAKEQATWLPLLDKLSKK
ncbi:MAG TPA: tripartite tricarboxylate transporter substrate binding protein [Xanthobacteraceae bacterium]|nr:tripartite tricarboxylate transporter substrate binding protein [Xanthobacteraceae bacterium]